MNYLSFMFVILVLISMLLYYLVPKKVRGIILLCSSLVFYLSYDLRYILFLMFICLTTFCTAKKLKNTNKSRSALLLCIFSNVFIWFILKLLPWTVRLINILFSHFKFEFKIEIWNLIAPIGISYYILKAFSYIIDVYKNKIDAEKSLWKYLLYLSYFPTIVQGPISRYDDLMKELLNDKEYSFELMRNSLILILFGLVKKVVIADRLGIFVNYTFTNYKDLVGIPLYLGAIFYSIQIYLDFSGCVDICRGVSKLFNVNLEHNFDRPYLADSIKDFWNRWHISLSRWLRDYIYISLGGNRKGKVRKYVNILITFIVSSIWHGAGFSFIFWGMLHALYEIISDISYKIRIKFKECVGVKKGSISDKIYKKVITFNLVTFAWIFFRSTSFTSAFGYIKNMLNNLNLWVLFDNSLYKCGINQNYFVLLFIHLIVIFFIENKFKKQEEVIDNLTNLHIGIRWAIYFILIFDIILFGVYGTGYNLSDFMYGGF